jgi:hypothetical protein
VHGLALPRAFPKAPPLVRKGWDGEGKGAAVSPTSQPRQEPHRMGPAPVATARFKGQLRGRSILSEKDGALVLCPKLGSEFRVSQG